MATWVEEALFKAKAVNELDTERDRAMPSQKVRQGAKEENASPASALA
jgi:predicted secreted protein